MRALWEWYIRYSAKLGSSYATAMFSSSCNGGAVLAAGRTVSSPARVTGRLRFLGTIVVLLLALAWSQAGHAQQVELPEGFVLEQVMSGLNNPVDLAFAANGFIFIAEKPGRVRVAVGGRLLDRPFIDIEHEVNPIVDRGLVGIAVHPRFPAVPYVYISYTYEPPETLDLPGERWEVLQGSRASRLLRVAADPTTGYATALPGSEVVLLGRNSTAANMGDLLVRNPVDSPACGDIGEFVQDCLPANENSHTIGRVRFGPDGMLWVSNGDGTDYTTTQPYHVRSQYVDSLAGKVLRIDPETGEGLPDNPFYDGDPQSNRSKVVSYGLRNPYSFAFHPETGELIMGEVGWVTWEMIKVGTGYNFGWPCYEGGNGELFYQWSFYGFEECQALYEIEDEAVVKPPSYGYDHLESGAAIILGDYILDTDWPEQYHGLLLIADYYHGWIRTIDLDLVGPSPEPEPFAVVPFPVYIGFGPDRELYYLNVWSGELMRISYEGEG